MMRPHIVRRIVDSRGNVVKEFKPEVMGRVVRPSVTQQMIELMEGVVRYGTATKAQIPGYRVGGKTGTARKVPYTEKRYLASFVGVLPLESPRLCIYVWVDNPKKHKYGGDVAVPIFNKVAETSLKTLGIPPSVEVIPEATPVPPAILASEGIDEVGPCAYGTSEQDMVAGQDNQELSKEIMPDLMGLTMRKALVKLSSYHVQPQFVGSGIVIDQTPQPGKPVEPGARCLVIFGTFSDQEVARAD